MEQGCRYLRAPVIVLQKRILQGGRLSAPLWVKGGLLYGIFRNGIRPKEA